MRSPIRRPGGPRRGVTLVEMLVVVALVVLMMVILVQIFQSATGAMSLSRTTQELDIVLRQVDSMIRADLTGSTACMNPSKIPAENDPTLKRGYFTYGENSPADRQGEDTDDWMALTTKAPQGQVFSGRQWINFSNPNIQPITITSQVGEVLYFLRNHNLYRRVLLVAPERAKSIGVGAQGGGSFYPNVSTFGGALNVSWQGMNDISCRPGGFTANGIPIPIPNDLGDLTNRENRIFSPRFMNDFNPKDGIPDDNNGDGLNDYYPTLYYNGVGGHAYKDANNNPIWSPDGQTNEVLGFPGLSRFAPGAANSFDVYPFPFIYPGMYSVPDNTAPASRVSNGLGWVHYQPQNNHSPLDLGDSLPVPPLQAGPASPLNQTWWGFPTWRETMTGTRGALAGWTDPVLFVSNLGTQPNGLRPIAPNVLPSANAANLLPPVLTPGTGNVPFSFDGVGSGSFVAAPSAVGSTVPISPNPLWEDDLILTNVRSFDIKAYDINAPLYNTANNGLFSAGYQDLGYGYGSYVGGLTGSGAGVQNAVPFQGVYPLGSVNATGVNISGVSMEPVGFGHEGRIPPLPVDFRYHPRWQGFNGTNTFGNVGDPSASVIRLTRVWDSWSTDYSKAPDSDYFANGFIPGFNLSPPIYPSFPAPYPSPLRGIQIQIRIVDPRNERSKVLTIRHDFTDKL